MPAAELSKKACKAVAVKRPLGVIDWRWVASGLRKDLGFMLERSEIISLLSGHSGPKGPSKSDNGLKQTPSICALETT